MALTEQVVTDIKQSFKRCSSDTVEAIISFRETKNGDLVPTIVKGIIERYLPPEVEVNMDNVSEETRLIEDLGIDSLTMLEIVLSIEDALELRIEDSELREIKTMGDVSTFIKDKLNGSDSKDSNVSITKKYFRDELMVVLPQQPPFLFLNSAEIKEDVTLATYPVDEKEYFFEGHFKDEPILPACIVFEAVGQAACLWVVENAPQRCNVEIKNNQVVFASMAGSHFHKRVKPGETLTIEVTLKRLRNPLAIFGGVVKSGEDKVAVIEELVLAFGDIENIGSHTKADNKTDKKAVSSS